MIPENIYKPTFGTHNMPRYFAMQAELRALINDLDQQVCISMKHFSNKEVSIYVQHILRPLVLDFQDKNIPYHLMIVVGRDGESNMTALRNGVRSYAIQFKQETRRKMSIYG